MTEGKILIVIPARGGSKGIPRKNIRMLNKHPLIYYSIKTCLQSKHQVDVYVSSEDDEILTLSEKFGAKTLRRSIGHADDATTLDPVIFEAFDILKIKKSHYVQINL